MSTEADVWLYNGTLFVSLTYLASFIGLSVLNFV